MPRLFDDNPAVVFRSRAGVVLDRDMLPRTREDGTPYILARTRLRWISYIDGPSKYRGEWETFSSAKEAIADCVAACEYLED